MFMEEAKGEAKGSALYARMSVRIRALEAELKESASENSSLAGRLAEALGEIRRLEDEVRILRSDALRSRVDAEVYGTTMAHAVKRHLEEHSWRASAEAAVRERDAIAPSTRRTIYFPADPAKLDPEPKGDVP